MRVLFVFSFLLCIYGWNGIMPLETVSLSFVNYYQHNAIGEVQIDTNYGNIIGWKPFVPYLPFNGNINIFALPDCGQGSVQVTFDYNILDSNNNTIGSEKSMVTITPISYDFFYTNNTASMEFRFLNSKRPSVSAEVVVLNSMTDNQQYTNNIHNIHNNKNELSLKPIINDNINNRIDFKVVNFTICNNLDHGEAKLLAFPRFWGRSNNFKVPKTIPFSTCGSFTILPKCKGGLLGANVSYVALDIEHKMSATIGPNYEEILTTGNANCSILSTYPTKEPEIHCSIERNENYFY